ncbi:hypothetical protein R6Q57_020701 [Mikania cordata]
MGDCNKKNDIFGLGLINNGELNVTVGGDLEGAKVGIELDVEKSLVEVESILSENRVLISEINQNHESMIPDNITTNVGLIRELNNNIRKVVHLYSNLSQRLVNKTTMS